MKPLQILFILLICAIPLSVPIYYTFFWNPVPIFYKVRTVEDTLIEVIKTGEMQYGHGKYWIPEKEDRKIYTYSEDGMWTGDTYYVDFVLTTSSVK